jgi:hypothetical protein
MNTPLHSCFVVLMRLSGLFALAFVVLAAFSMALVAQIPGVPQPSKQSSKQPAAQLPDNISLDSLANLDPSQLDLSADEVIRYYSHGWFPTPFPAFSLGWSGGGCWMIQDARQARPAGTVPTRNAFSPQHPFDERGHRWILREGRRGDRESDYEADYPSDSEYDIVFGVRGTLNLPVPAILRFGVAYNTSAPLLFSRSDARFLAPPTAEMPSQRQGLYEVSVISLWEQLLQGSLGLTIPVYGAFFQPVDEAAIASYYYLHVGGALDYVLSSRLTQFMHIANAKEQVRYQNGRDTLRVVDNQPFSGIVPLRPMVDVAIGFAGSVGANIPRIGTFGGGRFGLEYGIELFGLIPTTGITTDNTWRQYMIGIRTYLGYQWLK